MQQLIAIGFIILGLIALIASIFDQDWFFSSHNASFLVSGIGRKGSRIIYAFLGMLLIISGILMILIK